MWMENPAVYIKGDCIQCMITECKQILFLFVCQQICHRERTEWLIDGEMRV